MRKTKTPNRKSILDKLFELQDPEPFLTGLDNEISFSDFSQDSMRKLPYLKRNLKILEKNVLAGPCPRLKFLHEKIRQYFKECSVSCKASIYFFDYTHGDFEKKHLEKIFYDKAFPCPVCNKVLESIAQFCLHFRFFHPDLDLKILSNFFSTQKVASNKKIEKFIIVIEKGLNYSFANRKDGFNSSIGDELILPTNQNPQILISLAYLQYVMPHEIIANYPLFLMYPTESEPGLLELKIILDSSQELAKQIFQKKKYLIFTQKNKGFLIVIQNTLMSLNMKKMTMAWKPYHS